MTPRGFVAFDLDPYPGHGRDPYNTATTDRRHVIKLAERFAERRRIAKLYATIAASREFLDAAKLVINRAFGKFAR